MSKTVSIILVSVVVACSLFAMSAYKKEQPGKHLFSTYFDAAPSQGYTTQRSLSASANDTDASIIRQAYTYHKSADYDLALMSFRAYLESNPLPVSDETLLLAGTSAVATGNYAEGADYLDQIDQEGEYASEAWWHLALIDLQRGDLKAAKGELARVANSRYGHNFPTAQIMEELTEK
ncbi:hypothetical protein FUA23_21595 [Neolewinella aurantiaca]|uniref:Tetratricopeptide repeat protein n=1 Tax=Neolewinella aurantiaca TaxID=2602767 RepID=A0A5C7FAU9_9BACT|nr:hypothetical protein [Neolewinella aurantiaca]TXF83360.1 hypothetical protein FUA23_21595 [Neolewinella aurantiaca]